MNAKTAIGLVALVAASECGAAKPRNLTVEYRENPIGIDEARPRFSWKLPDGMARQSAYEIDAGTWRTGKVASGESLNAAVWGGAALRPSQRVRWRVRVWDEKDQASEWSDPAAFVMGMTADGDWQAKWIGPNRITRPDVDFGGARWIGGEKVAGEFAWDGSDGVCELVYSCTRPHKIFVNGRPFSESDGMVYDFRHPRFRDLRPFLKKGRNTISFELPSAGFKSIVQRDPPGEIATLALVRLPGGVRFASGPDWGGLDLGGARETDWGAELDLREETVSPVFAKAFAVRGKVRRATLHVTGLGFYEASLNGVKVGDKVLDPSPTDYDRRVLYSTYVLDDLLRPGDNELRIALGHGWYDVRSIATWNFDVAPWRGFPRCVARLEIEYADGTSESVVTDGSWRQVVGDVAYDCIREGEVIGRREPVALPPDLRAEEVPAPKGALEAERMPGAKVVRRIRPREIRTLADGTCVVTFPENVAGWAKIRFRGLAKGDEVGIRYDENLTPEGNGGVERMIGEPWRTWTDGDRLVDIHYRYPASQRFASGTAGFQIDHFIASGVAEETYEPRFTFNGFRHLLVRGLRDPLREEDVEACCVRTDFREIGEFACSDRTLTELVRMACNSYRVNFTDGYPTDCPHREKLGWTGDGWIASEFAQYFFENTSAYGKWVQDNVDAQRADGVPCSIVPTDGWGYETYNGPTFDAVLATVPWNLWAYRGDRRALDVAYPAICRYIEAESRRETAPGLVANGLGDWNAAVPEHMPTPEYVISANYYHILRLASKIAAVKGLSGEAEKYVALARRTADAINAKYLKAGGVYDNGGQTAQALPLVLGFAPAEDRAAVAARLVEAVERADGHVDLGLVGMKHVFRALSIAGRSDLAVRMLTNPTAPSPARWIGKTSTLWEDWGVGLSKSHVMFGDFAAWSMQCLAGIRLESECAAIPDPKKPGFSRFLVAPDMTCGLDWVKASVDGPYGRIVSSWRRKGGKAVLEVEVPPNSEALVRFDGREAIVGPGRHVFGDGKGHPALPARTLPEAKGLALNAGRTILFGNPLPRMRCGGRECGTYNNWELAYPGVLTTLDHDLGDALWHLRKVVWADRRLVFIDGRTLVCQLNWIRDHIHQMKGYCHWERDLTGFLDFILDTQRDDGQFFELIKQWDDYHWAFVNPDCVRKYPEDNQTLVRLELEADIEYLMVEGCLQAWRATGDDAWLKSALPRLEKGIDYQTSDPKRWDPAHGLCKRPYTLDTWDFTMDPRTSEDRRVKLDEPMAILHGDNTGVCQAMRRLAWINERFGNAAKASAWRARADALQSNMMRHLWNGTFFRHQLPLNCPPYDGNETNRLTLSMAYALNRGVLTPDQCRGVIDEYLRRRGTTAAFAEWFTCDPPYEPKFGNHPSGEYVNGGISPFTAGELARGAFENGREAYGWDIVSRLVKMVLRDDGKLFFLYHPTTGEPQGRGPSAWGAAAVLSAVDQGLAGVTDLDKLYRRMRFAPRWAVTPYREGRYLTGYEVSGCKVDVRWVFTDAGFRYRLESPAESVTAHLLVPNGRVAAKLLVNGRETAFAVSTVGESAYVDAEVRPERGLADFEVLY